MLDPVTAKAAESAIGVLASSATEIQKPVTATLAKAFGRFAYPKTKLEEAINAVDDVVAKMEDLKNKEKQECPVGYQLNANARRWVSAVNNVKEEIEPNRMYDRKRRPPKSIPLTERHNIGRSSAKAVLRAKELISQYELFKTDKMLFDLAPGPALKFCSLPHVEFNEYECRIEKMEGIISAIDDSRNNLIEIYGTGGIGKTTMLVEIAKRIGNRTEESQRFQRVVYVKVSRQLNVGNIQDQIASQLKVELSNDRSNTLKQELCRIRSALILFDDVWTKLDFEEIGLPSKYEFPGVKVLTATRMTNLEHKWSTNARIPINFLTEDDSWNLFKEKAAVPDNLEGIAKEVKKECDGLPLALAVVGGALHGEKEELTWRNALHYLKESNPKQLENVEEKLYKCIQYSYDHLNDNDEEKHVFLLCCLFPESQEVFEEDLTRYLIGEDTAENIICLNKKRNLEGHIGTLVKHSLLLPSNKPGIVNMHDVVRDVGVYIAQKCNTFINCGAGLQTKLTNENFRRCQRMSLIKSGITETFDQPDCAELRMLLLRENEQITNLSRDFFKKMKNLVVLDMSGSKISSLPKSIGYLENLQTFCLNGCTSLNSREIEKITSLRKLIVLSLRGCAIDSLPKGMNNLQELRVLDLKKLGDLQITVDLFHGLRLLQVLHMDSKLLTETVLIEIAKLKHLKDLELYVNDINIFSSDAVATDLIASWDSFFIYNQSFQVPRSKQKSLHLKGVHSIGKWIKVLLVEAENLIFEDCFTYNIISFDLAKATGVSKFEKSKIIRLTQCKTVKFLSVGSDNRAGAFRDLEEIYMTNLEKLTGISGMKIADGSFGKIRIIHMKNCGKVNCVIPSNLLQRVHLSLQEISVTMCAEVQTIFEFAPNATLQNFFLKFIQLGNLPELINICQGNPPAGTFANLKELIVEDCNRLTSVFTTNLAAMLASLQKLTIKGNSGLTEIVHDDGTSLDMTVFPSVAHLSLLHLNQLQHFHKVGGNTTYLQWPKLVFLKLGDCPNFLRLPIGQRSAPELQKIELSAIDDQNWYSTLIWDDPQTPNRFTTSIP